MKKWPELSEAAMSKTQQMLELLEQGKHREALRIASTFRLGLSPADQKALKTAYEALTHPSFYRQLGIDLEQAVKKGLEVCLNLNKEKA